jgi:nicotinate-nucleotide pyrophosphorylase
MQLTTETVRTAVTAGLAEDQAADDVTTRWSVPAELQVEASGSGSQLEASGTITLDTVADVAATGVDAVSVGALTHSRTALDISLLVARDHGVN